MFSAIFAVLLLSRLSTAEIYVGQNPQNVNAVVKDSSGNLVPVTGVADTIEVVDLNYGNEPDNETGMAVDISVTPVTTGGSGGMSTMPVNEYPTVNTMPVSENPTMSTMPVSENPTMSTMPVSENPTMSTMPASENPTMNSLPVTQSATTPSAPSIPASASPTLPQPSLPSTIPSFPAAGPSAPAPLPISNPPINQSTQPAFNPTVTTASANSPSGPITPLPSVSGFGSSASPPTAFPFAPSNPENTYNNIVSSLTTPQTSNANSEPPSQSANGGPLSSPSASSPGKSPPGNLLNPFGFNPLKPFGIGPKKNPLNNLFVELGGSLGPVVQPSNNLSQSVNPSQPFANGTSQPITLMSSASGNINSPSTDNEDSISSILNNLSPMDAINQLLFPNSSSANSSIAENDVMDIDEEIDPLSLLENFAPSMADNLPNITTGPLNLSDLSNAVSGTVHKWNDALSSSLRSMFPSVGSMFGVGNPSPLIFSISPSKNANTLNFTNFFAGQNTTMPSVNKMLNSLLNTGTSFNFTNLLMPGSGTSPTINKLLNSLVGNSTKPINFINPFSMGNLSTLAAQNMLNNLLPSILSDPLEYDNYYEEPENMLEPDYLEGSSMPSMFGSFPSKLNNLNLQQKVFNPLINGTTSLNGMLSMLQNLLSPDQNGVIPFANMVSNIFTPNSTMLFGPSPLLNSSFFNPMNFTSPVNISSLFAMNNNQPLSNWNTIVSVLNNTGMFGDLSGLSSMIQNLSALATQAKSGGNKMAVLKQAFGDVAQMSNITNSIMQNFMKNVGLSPTQNLTSLIAQAESNSNTSAQLNEALSDVMSMWNFARQTLLSSLKNVGFNPSALNFNSFLPSSFQFPSSIPKFPSKSPKPAQPLVSPNIGTSFLVIPPLPPNLENNTLNEPANVNSVPVNFTSWFGSFPPMSGNLNLQEQVFNPLTDGKTSLSSLISMINGLLTPNQNGTNPFQSIIDTIFKPNSTMLFGPSPLLNSSFFNPMNFTSMNLSSPLNLTENQLFMDWNSIISDLNSTGMFGDLSGLSSILSNVSSLIAEANSTNKMAILKQALSDVGSLSKYTNSISQTLLKNLGLTAQNLTSKFSQFEESDDGSAEMSQAISDVTNTWNSIFKMLGLNPSAFNLNSFLPPNIPSLPFPPKSSTPFSRLPLQIPLKMPKPFAQPSISPRFGTSFLVIPPSPPAVQSDILTPVSPVVNSTLVDAPRNGSSMPMIPANATSIPVTVSVNQSSQPLSITPTTASANESSMSHFDQSSLEMMQNSAPAAPTNNSNSTKTDDAVFDYIDTSATNLDNSTTAKPSEESNGSYRSAAFIGINASPTLLMLIGFLFVAMNQKMFA